MSDTKLTPYYVSMAVLLVLGMGLIVSSLYVEHHKIFFFIGILLVLSALGVSIAAYMKKEHYWAPPLDGGGMFLGLADPGEMAACNAIQLASETAQCPTCTAAAKKCLGDPGCNKCSEQLDNCQCKNKYVKDNMNSCIIGQTPQYL